jgi:Polymerase beta, Nucleotidyltransferase
MMRRYGCFARGEPRQRSAIDIAILPRDELSSGIIGELEADIEESAIPYDVALVDLRQARRRNPPRRCKVAGLTSRRPGARACEGIGLETKAGCGRVAVRGSRRASGAPHHDVRY